MKRIGTLVLLLLVNSLIFSAIHVQSGPTIPGALIDHTEEALNTVMGPRLKENQELRGFLTEEADRYLLTVNLDGRELMIPIPLSWEAEPSYISDSLVYDGLALLDELPPLMIDVISKTSVLVENPDPSVRVGDRFWAIDARGNRIGLLGVRRVDESWLLLQQEGGKTLQVGMGLVQGPEIPVYLSMSIDAQRVFGVHAGACIPLRLYPFSLAVEGGTLGGREFSLGAGVKARVSFSQLFGTGWTPFRALSFNAAVSGGGAYSLGRGWGGYVQGTFLLEYVLGRWIIFAGGGERMRAFGLSVHDGLFFVAGTAYTF